jgi:DnaJ-class molecular chaperone|tara:strand:- start:136 stop:582 length:447 start_codon:yes stop_codon:yes gene_type:complete
MKRVNEYKKLFNIEGDLELKSLKSTYRKLVKEWHPDKFQDGDDKAKEAELMGKKVIDGYHFLVSIAPETKAANLDEYNASIATGISDYKHKGLLFEIDFLDGNTYEYFGISKAVYIKMCNSDKQMRFAKRNILTSVLYRKKNKNAKAV